VTLILSGRGGRRLGALFAVLAIAATLAACSSSSKPASSGGTVLLVGTFHGHAGQYKSIQAAVNAAKPGDWILVAPGDYHENADLANPPKSFEHGDFGGVLITKSNVHLRGMNRSSVVVDGTKPGSSTCSADPSAQQFGAKDQDGKAAGRNGIVAWLANGVSVENLTVCNFLGGADDSGNQVWWNGGADTGKIGLHGYTGRYLTATSSYFGDEKTAAQYGIFSSDAQGPGLWDQLYASNFNDSGMYVGACLQVCDVTINHAWMEYSVLGYSGTNSGGSIVIENSQFDNNQDGFDTNTQLNGDPPAPQNGACPGNGISPITHTHSCWVFMHNYVHDNNNPNAPKAGTASNGPLGTGMTVSGGRNDTVMNNTFSNNGAWGILFAPFPDSNKPEMNQTCSGTGGTQVSGLGCVYEAYGNALLNNTFSHNGFFGNPSNSDYGQIILNPGKPRNCYRSNTAPNGSSPADLEQTQPTCGPTQAKATGGGDLLNQALCDTGFGKCPAGSHYPATTGVVMHPLPAALPSMPNPCIGVPANPWCPHGAPLSAASGPSPYTPSQAAAAPAEPAVNRTNWMRLPS
jgi:hypothetical protein